MPTTDVVKAGPKVKPKRRPPRSAFEQQRLRSWMPILTAEFVLPTFFVIGVTFVPIGIALLVCSNNVNEKSVDYTTDCKYAGTPCADILNRSGPASTCECNISFVLTTNFDGEVYMYYGLSNFFQNIRLYVDSRDDDQLLGHLDEEPSANCHPFDRDGENRKIAPCGAIANSLFNDTLELYWDDHPGDPRVPLLNQGIAWPSDKQGRFKNPEGNLRDVLTSKGYVKPIAWSKNLWELDPTNESNNGFQNEDLIVWMRTAALSNFRKLYRRIDHSHYNYRNGLAEGNYTLNVKYRYPVMSFGGRKRMILSTTSVIGGKNPFLGIAYIAIGCICLALCVLFVVIDAKFSKSASEMVAMTCVRIVDT